MTLDDGNHESVSVYSHINHVHDHVAHHRVSASAQSSGVWTLDRSWSVLQPCRRQRTATGTNTQTGWQVQAQAHVLLRTT